MKIVYLSIAIILLVILDSCTTVENSVEKEKKKSGYLTEEVISEEEAENNNYYNDSFIRFKDHVYSPNIHTVLCYKKGFELNPPIINLNSGDQIEVRFDDFDGDVKSFQYSVIHCNKDWTQSDLTESEYITGFPTQYINDTKFSFNTLFSYSHYVFSFPHEDFKLTKSGNYILKVFTNNNPDEVVITRRFMVVENKLKITPKVNFATNIDDRDYRQEIDFKIDVSTTSITNPYQELFVVLQQNNRWDNQITGLKPLFIRGNELEYDYGEENVFDGLNEYRYFDIKTIRLATEMVEKISYDSSDYHVHLIPMRKRTYSKYMTYQDINGKFLIHRQEGFDHHLEADYVWVHFFLPFPNALTDGNVYVFGQLSDYQYKEDYLMSYNYDRQGYELKAYLKQGYYNYMYMYLKDGNNAGDGTFMEGNHYETENQYNILVYHRDISSDYDRLIGYKSFNSQTSR